MYEEIMELWKIGATTGLANYMNKRGIYSASNPNHKNRTGSYEWVNPKDGSTGFDLLVPGVMLFPSHLRYINKGVSK